MPIDPARNRYPLNYRGSRERQQHYDTPVEGVPDWLEESLWVWVRARISGRANARGDTAIRTSTLQEFERKARLPVSSLVDTYAWRTLDNIRAWLSEDPSSFLTLVDFLVGKERDERSVEQLKTYLREAGSVWMVDTSMQPFVLVRRVSPELQGEHAAAVEKAPESAATLLTLAWRAAYGMQPHPSDAYRSAVRAVEALLVPKTIPKDGNGTLGKVISHLNDARAKWAVALPGDKAKVDALDTFLALLRHLWTGQYDRHVTDGAPLHVSQEEAEQAVLVAITVTQLVVTGAFQYRAGANSS